MEYQKDALRKYFSIPIIMASLLIGLAGCGGGNSTGPDPGPDPEEKNPKPEDQTTITEVAEGDDQLSTFYDLMMSAEVDAKLSSSDTYTVFAPTDSAFEKLPDGFIDDLSEDQLKKFLNYHITAGEETKSSFEDETSIKTEQGDAIFFEVGGSVVINNNSTILEQNEEASNGIIQKVDDVLIPDSYLTVFGVIQKRYELSKFACHCTSGRTRLDVVLQRKDSDFTVFVPSDQAFKDAEVKTDDLSDSELKEILNYHIVEKKITTDDLSDGQTLTTRNGQDITISVSGDDKISLNGGEAKVKKMDLEGTNGVAYVIDALLIPDQE